MLKQQFHQNIIPQLVKQLDLDSPMAVPRVQKVVINTGLGETRKNQQDVEGIRADLAAISGQLPTSTLARKSIAGFNVREGEVVGLKVTLRGQKMWDFLEKVIRVALPRTKDFQGINPNAVDSQGNLTIGFTDQLAFPELSEEKVQQQFGLEVVVTTSAHAKEDGLLLLEKIGIPFKSGNQ